MSQADDALAKKRFFALSIMRGPMMSPIASAVMTAAPERNVMYRNRLKMPGKSSAMASTV